MAQLTIPPQEKLFLKLFLRDFEKNLGNNTVVPSFFLESKNYQNKLPDFYFSLKTRTSPVKANDSFLHHPSFSGGECEVYRLENLSSQATQTIFKILVIPAFFIVPPSHQKEYDIQTDEVIRQLKNHWEKGYIQGALDVFCETADLPISKQLKTNLDFISNPSTYVDGLCASLERSALLKQSKSVLKKLPNKERRTL
jgi:hypothetical protein